MAIQWAPVAAAGLNFASSLFGGGDSSARQSRLAVEAEERAKANQIWWARNGLKLQVEGARAAGIHPLHAIGLPATAPSASYAASAPASGGSGFSRFAEAGADLARSIHAGSSPMERLQERLLEAQIKGQEIDNVYRASQVARVNAAPGNPPQGVMIGERLQDMPHPGIGRRRGVHPLHTLAVDEDGGVIRLFNEQDLGDNDAAQWLHSLRYTVPDAIQSSLVRPVKRFFSNRRRGVPRHYR